MYASSPPCAPASPTGEVKLPASSPPSREPCESWEWWADVPQAAIRTTNEAARTRFIRGDLLTAYCRGAPFLIISVRHRGRLLRWASLMRRQSWKVGHHGKARRKDRAHH